MTDWTTQDIPPQARSVSVITGATGGLGYETALALAGAGATVILTGRNAAKGASALAAIRAAHPAAAVSYETLDVASLASVAGFAEKLAASHDMLDLLVNNAGVMLVPTRQLTPDGFELQFGTNYLGHFALTAHLLPLLRRSRAPRVVNLSSVAHRLQAAIHFDDLQWARGYRSWPAYAQSKLAMLMFALELQRRSDAHGWGLMGNAAHPGYALTGLQSTGPSLGKSGASLIGRLSDLVGPLFGQPAAAGALPTLFAATAPNAAGGAYYGPQGVFEMKGAVGPARISAQAQDAAAAARLWEVSASLTGASWPD